MRHLHLCSHKHITRWLKPAKCSVIYNTETQRSDGNNVEQNDHLINLLLEIRQEARSRKDWDTSDKIRDRLKELNIEIQDTREGATWKVVP